MPIYFREDSLDLLLRPRPLFSAHIGEANILRIYNGDNLVHDRLTDGPIQSPQNTSDLQRYNHLINLNHSLFVLYFSASDTANDLYRESTGSGIYQRRTIKQGFPLRIDRVRVRTDLVLLNRQSAFGGSFTNNWRNNNAYTGTSFYLIDSTNNRFLELTKADVNDSGGGFINWPAPARITYPFNALYSTFRTEIELSTCFVMLAESGYSLF